MRHVRLDVILIHTNWFWFWLTASTDWNIKLCNDILCIQYFRVVPVECIKAMINVRWSVLCRVCTQWCTHIHISSLSTQSTFCVGLGFIFLLSFSLGYAFCVSLAHFCNYWLCYVVLDLVSSMLSNRLVVKSISWMISLVLSGLWVEL